MNISFLKELTIALLFITVSCGRPPDVAIVVGDDLPNPVRLAMATLERSLAKKGISFEKTANLKNVKSNRVFVVESLETAATNTKFAKPESLSINKSSNDDNEIWTIKGSDARGLQYALMNIAERIDWAAADNPFGEIREMNESADVETRAISLYTMNRAYWESRFYNEDYWARYFDVLTKNRFNTVVVIFGYENAGFLAPSYPYFFDVDGYPDVKMRSITPQAQAKNLKALNRMIDMAHERGLDFKVGIWDHIYRGGVQAGGLSNEELATFDTGHLVDGLNAENLPPYTKAALTKFMKEVPNLDGIQFRMHNESGLKRGAEMAQFWNEIFTMMKETSPNFKIDLRAKELPESIIKVAHDLGLNFTITTKYWMEQMGLPFHPTHINRENQLERRHGYADMLRYPKDYSIHWRMWNGGTNRLMLWGSPEYAKRFVASTHLYDGNGYEVNEPLATKMEAQPHDKPPFDILNKPYQYYEYEFERYWHFYQVFGRLGYNPEIDSQSWDAEFAQRFGARAGPKVKEALHKASWILPMIVGACAPYGKFPTTRGWAGKQRFGDLHQYAIAEGSDIQQFASFDTEAKLLIEGGETAKRLPSATSDWFKSTHDELDELIVAIEQTANTDENKELFSTITDLRILSKLALFHATRIPAAVNYRIYERTKDPHALDDAMADEKEAIAVWQQVVAAAADVYAPDLMFGMRERAFGGIVHHLSGHWKEELGYLEKGLMELEEKRKELGVNNKPRTAPTYKPIPSGGINNLFQITHEPVKTAPLGQPIQISVHVEADNGVKWVRLRHRAVNQHLDYETLPMKSVENGNYEVRVPAKMIDTTYNFMYFIEVMDKNGNGLIHPNLEVETPYVILELER